MVLRLPAVFCSQAAGGLPLYVFFALLAHISGETEPEPYVFGLESVILTTVSLSINLTTNYCGSRHLNYRTTEEKQNAVKTASFRSHLLLSPLP